MPNSKQNFLAGVNLDANQLRIPTSENKCYSPFILNMTRNVQQNPTSSVQAGSNEGVYTPLEGNSILTYPFNLPGGTNYCVGFYNSEQTNEGYVWIWNTPSAPHTLPQHSILQISGVDGTVTYVYGGALPCFSGDNPDPTQFICEGRATLVLRNYIDPVTGKETNFKFLIFTTGIGEPLCIEVNSSIATNSFSPSYSSGIFAGAGTDPTSLYDPLTLISLGVDTPIRAADNTVSAHVSPIVITQLANTGLQLQKQNLLIRVGWQFRVKFIDVYGRESIHGIMSDVFISIVGGGCISESNSMPRCLQLQFDGGCPLVDYIQIEYRKTIGNATLGCQWTDWLTAETITKRKHQAGVEWYDREAGTYLNATTNVITYTFCGDKGSIPNDVTETDLVQPGLPRTSNTVSFLNTKVALGNNVRNFDNLPNNITELISFSADIPGLATCNPPPLCTVTVYANVYTPRDGVDEGRPVWKVPAGTLGISSPVTGWGAAHGSGGACDNVNMFTTHQFFADNDNPGFIAYISGQSGVAYSCVMEQGYLNVVPGVTYGTWTPQRPQDSFETTPGNTYTSVLMHRAVFTIPAGKYIARIASHHVKINDSNIQQTSTQVAGRVTVADCTSTHQPPPIPPATPVGRYKYCQDTAKEWEIDCSDGLSKNYNQPTDKVLIILDMSDIGGSSADGYLYEELTGVPIEMAPVYVASTDYIGAATKAYGSFYTDHNGYYFMASPDSAASSTPGSMAILIGLDYCDGNGGQVIWSTGNNDVCIKHGNGEGVSPGTCSAIGYWFNKIYAAGALYNPTTPINYTSIPFPSSGRRIIYANVTQCDNVSPVPGVPVVMTKGGTGITDFAGTATVIAHNRYRYTELTSVVPSCPYSPGTSFPFGGHLPCYVLAYMATYWSVGYPYPQPILADYIPDYSQTPGAADDLIIYSQKPGCNWFECGDCNVYAIDDESVPYVPCTTIARTTTLPSVALQGFGIDIKGVQSGGRYPVGFVLEDTLGRVSAVQTAQGESGYVNIPNLNDKLTLSPLTFYQKFELCQIRYSISSSFAAPGFKRLTLCVAPNTVFSDYMSWAADWVQFVDASGMDNTVNPTSVRIYISSLNEYSKHANYTNNNGWVFQANNNSNNSSTQNEGAPVVGDIIQFIMNGNGGWMNAGTNCAVTSSVAGSFFTVDFIPQIATLTNGALFRVIRPITNQNNTIYYEQAITIDLNPDGTVPADKRAGVIPYFDSYMLARAIPVPVLGSYNAGNPSATPPIAPSVGSQPGGISPGGTPLLPLAYSDSGNSSTNPVTYSTTNPNVNHVIIQTAVDVITAFPFLFESPSPSDFWGSHLANRGRQMSINPYAKQTRTGTEICTSAAVGDRGLLNGMSWFDLSNIQIFDRNTWGNIQLMLPEVSELLVICERDHFITRFNSTQLQVDSQGQVSGQNPYGMFQAPTRRQGANYGVASDMVNTVRKWRGIVRWIDSSGVMVRCDYNNSVGELNTGFSGWLRQMVAGVKELNFDIPDNGLTYWVAGIDPKTSTYALTIFNATNPSSGYINNNIYVTSLQSQINQTILVNHIDGSLEGFASFTPEYYGTMPLYYSQAQFMSFVAGQAWNHHDITIPAPFASFYSTQCSVAIAIVVNAQPEKVKSYMAVEIYCNPVLSTTSGGDFIALFFADTGQIITEHVTAGSHQVSRLSPSQWRIANGFQCAAILMDENTPYDPNLPVATGANKLFDGNPLIGRWLQATFQNQTQWQGDYFELSAINVIYGLVEKSAD